MNSFHSTGHSETICLDNGQFCDNSCHFQTKNDGPAHDRIQGLWAFKRETFSGVDSLNPVDETTWMNTNTASQWGLATIQNLALVRQELPPNDRRVQ